MGLATAESLDERWSAYRSRPRNHLALSIRHLVTQRAWFEAVIMSTIVFVGVMSGVELDSPNAVPGLSVFVDSLALVVFTMEAVLKILAEGERPAQYFLHPEDGAFNTFDFAIVILSFAFLGQEGQGTVQTMRLVRLLRLLSLVKNVTQLRVIVIGLVQGMKSSLYIVMLLVMVIYIFSIVAVDLFGESWG